MEYCRRSFTPSLHHSMTPPLPHLAPGGAAAGRGRTAGSDADRLRPVVGQGRKAIGDQRQPRRECWPRQTRPRPCGPASGPISLPPPRAPPAETILLPPQCGPGAKTNVAPPWRGPVPAQTPSRPRAQRPGLPKPYAICKPTARFTRPWGRVRLPVSGRGAGRQDVEGEGREGRQSGATGDSGRSGGQAGQAKGGKSSTSIPATCSRSAPRHGSFGNSTPGAGGLC